VASSKAKFDIVVEVRREDDGQVYSRVLNRAVNTNGVDLTRTRDGKQRYVVIDRAKASEGR